MVVDDTDTLSAFLRTIEPWSTPALLASIGALELVPANINRLYRLQAGAEVAGAAWHPGDISPTRAELRRLTNSGALTGWVAAQEDLFNDVVHEEVGFHGGAYLVANGLLEQSTFILRALLSTLLSSDTPSAWRERNVPLAIAALRLSDQVFRGAGARRNDAPAPNAGVTVPPAQALERLTALLSATDGDLTPLVTQGGSLPARTELAPYGPLTRRPVVCAGDRSLLAVPTSLNAALCHQLVVSAIDLDAGDALARSYRREVQSVAEAALRRMGMRRVELALPDVQQLPLVQSVFQFDNDKLAALFVLTDPIVDYDVDVLGGGAWGLQADSDSLLAHIERVEAAMLAKSEIRQGLVVLAIQSVGREVMLGFEQPEREPFARLTLEASELPLLAVHEEREPLAMWKWARALAELRASVRLMAWHRVDEYGLYRVQHRSYLFAEGRTPTFMSLELDFGRDIRVEAKLRADHHPARYVDDTVIEVERYDAESGDVPIYAPLQLREQRVTFLVEAPDPVWVLGAIEHLPHFPYETFALTVAYWLWQAGPHVSEQLQELLSVQGTLVIEVDVEEPDRWLVGDVPEEDGHAARVRVTPERHLALTVCLTSQASLMSPDNRAERELLRTLLEGFRALGADTLSDDRIAGVVEQVAPLGRKKHLLLWDAGEPELSTAGLPPFRPVQDADRALVRQSVGAFFLASGHEPGPVAAGARSSLLAAAVAHCRQAVADGIAELDAEGLLEALALRVEAVVAEQARRRRTTPTRLACYEDVDRTHARLAEEMPRANLAGICTRYLVEVATASPPTGSEPLTLSRFDHLLALVAETVEMAYLSDAIYYELSDPELKLLEDGRLDVSGQDEYVAGQLAYFSDYVRAEIDRNESAFAGYWEREDAPDDATDPLDVGLLAESGLTMDEFKTGVVTLVDLGRSRGEGAATAALADVLAHLRSEGWTDDKARALIEFLALHARPDFLHPPAPYTDKDVDPWRFNRGLAYSRRPLLVRGADELVWGWRQLFASSRLILGLLRTGQYKASSTELRAAMGAIADERGHGFEDVIADLYEAHGYTVRRRVDRINGHRITGSDNQDLGDIDVLVVDEARRVLIAIDTKDLSVALTPSEVARELGRTFKTTGKREAAADKHLRRIEWVAQHIDTVHRALGLGHRPRRWRVEGLLVVDQEVASPYLVSPPVPVRSLRQLRADLQARGGHKKKR